MHSQQLFDKMKLSNNKLLDSWSISPTLLLLLLIMYSPNIILLGSNIRIIFPGYWSGVYNIDGRFQATGNVPGMNLCCLGRGAVRVMVVVGGCEVYGFHRGAVRVIVVVLGCEGHGCVRVAMVGYGCGKGSCQV